MNQLACIRIRRIFLYAAYRRTPTLITQRKAQIPAGANSFPPPPPSPITQYTQYTQHAFQPYLPLTAYHHSKRQHAPLPSSQSPQVQIQSPPSHRRRRLDTRNQPHPRPTRPPQSQSQTTARRSRSRRRRHSHTHPRRSAAQSNTRRPPAPIRFAPRDMDNLASMERDGGRDPATRRDVGQFGN